MANVIAILLMLSLYVPLVNGGMSYCDVANEAARSEDRRMIKVTADGKDFHRLLDVGECELTSDICVHRESYGPCGSITQFMDIHNDGMCDYIIIWKALVDPQYGVFFGVEKLSKCPISM